MKRTLQSFQSRRYQTTYVSEVGGILVVLLAIFLSANSGSADEIEYNNERIAMSFDGNSAPDPEYKWPTGDPDDWGALAASCAIIAKLELQEKLVHCSYNNFIDAPAGPDHKNQLKISADGAIERWNFNENVFFDVTRQLEAAVANLSAEMAKSTPEDPLYFIHAGLSEFVYLAVEDVIKKGKVESLSHVHLISHSRFNEDEKRRSAHRTWNDIQKLAGDRIQYTKIKDQNGKTHPNLLWNSGSNFSVWFWMRDHVDPDIRWLYSRVEAHSGNVADISDCGMLFFLFTGDEDGSPEKFKTFLGSSVNKGQNASVALSAIDDFQELSVPEFAPAYHDRVRKAIAINAEKHKDVFAAARTSFAGADGAYDVAIVTLTELDGESTYRLLVDGRLIGSFQNPATEKDYAPHSHVFPSVAMKRGSVIQVESNSNSNGKIPEGDAFAFSRGRWREISFQAANRTASHSDERIITIEAESMKQTTGWDTVEGAAASGGRFVSYSGPNSFSKVTEHLLSTTFEVSKPGRYTLKWWMRQPNDVAGDQANDAWIRFSDARQLARTEEIFGFHKFVGRSKDTFGFNGQLDLEGDQPWMTIAFPEAGTYQIEIAGRSSGFQLDKIVLYTDMSYEEAKGKLQPSS